jgi:hypothetical protein
MSTHNYRNYNESHQQILTSDKKLKVTDIIGEMQGYQRNWRNSIWDAGTDQKDDEI